MIYVILFAIFGFFIVTVFIALGLLFFKSNNIKNQNEANVGDFFEHSNIYNDDIIDQNPGSVASPLYNLINDNN